MATATKYVLTHDVWYRPEQGEDIEPVRYGKGAVLEDLTANEVKRLKRQGAIAELKSEEGKRASEAPAAPPAGVDPLGVEPTPYQQSEYGTALANSGLGPDDAPPGALSEEQVRETEQITEAQAEAMRAAQAAGGANARLGAGSGDVERPAKSATADEWRRWAVKSGKVSADAAETMNKGDLQALK